VLQQYELTANDSTVEKKSRCVIGMAANEADLSITTVQRIEGKLLTHP
jgi:hypothetical protein